ncbi:MAG: FAD-dependent oxidoreductase [Myxococcota bacterium]
MNDDSRVAIVGASLAGLRTAEFLRRGGFEGTISLVGEEPHRPYDRPPLSKQILRGEWEADRLELRRRSYDDLKLDLRLGQRAVKLDAVARQVSLESGDVVEYDKLVIATGGRVRCLPNQPTLEGLFTLRTVDDALAIRAALGRARRVVVVGAGFIGAEVAASARQLGLEVSMVELLPAPMAHSLGTRIGSVLAQMHEREGVQVLCGHAVTAFEGRGSLEAVRLDDGSVLPCDVAVVGIGVEPVVDWLEGSGLELADGVRCDATCEASVGGVYAVGDVASWYNPLFEEQMRVEHWTHAVEQARYVAGVLTTNPEEAQPFESVPMFWSDQYDLKIQGVGRPRSTDEVLVTGGAEGQDKFVALYERSGRLVGAVAFNLPPKIIALRNLIANRGNLEDGIQIAES